MDNAQLIITKCQFCGAVYKVLESHLGKKVPCARCKKAFDVKQESSSETCPSLEKLAITYQLITPGQLKDAIRVKVAEEKAGRKSSIADILVKNGTLSSEQIKILHLAQELWKTRNLDIRFGQIGVQRGAITQEQVNTALAEQANDFRVNKSIKLIGDILVEKQIISPSVRDSILAEQKRVVSDIEKLFWQERKLDKVFAMIAVKKSMILKEEAEQALTDQAQYFKDKQSVKLVGDILVEKGLMSPNDRETLLQAQKRIETKDTKVDDAETDAQTDKADEDDAEGQTFVISISDDQVEAYIRAVKDIDNSIDVDFIRTLLRDANIKFGIVNNEMISNYLKNEAASKKLFKIAQGKVPNPGRDASIQYYFVVDHLKAGKLSEDGTIDFKDRGEIPHVNEGDLLAEKIPMIIAEPGMDIYGNPIPVEKTKDEKLRAGTGTEMSADGRKIHAKISGQPSVTFGGKISVMSELVIKGDVGLETGHVNFDGNVRVRGTIQDDFKVDCGNLFCKEILEAEITTTGNVEVSGGIIGGKIKAQGDIKAKYIKGAQIEAYGNIVSNTEIVDCNIFCSGTCQVMMGKIISSSVSAKMGIQSKDIGTDISTPCKLRVGVDEHIEKELDGIRNAITRRREDIKKHEIAIADAENKQQEIHQQISDLAQVQDRSMVGIRDLKKLITHLEQKGITAKIPDAQHQIEDLEEKSRSAERSLNNFFDQQDQIADNIKHYQTLISTLSAEVEELVNEREAIKKWSKESKGFPVVKVTGTIYAKTAVHGVNVSTILKDNYSRASIKEVRISDPDSDKEWEMRIFHE